MSILETYECGIHDITYRRAQPGCPLCKVERELEKTKKDLDEAMGNLAELRGRAQKIAGASDIGYSIDSASNMLDERDRAFLKEVLYRWRDRKDIDLGLTESGRGFITADTIHECSSVGGLAIAGFFKEAIMAYGRSVAMSLLQRGMAKHLKGGT